MELQKRRLYRSAEDRIIAGVCGGLGKYFEIDPVFIRVIFVILFFASGIGILLYLLLILIIPREPGKTEPIPAAGELPELKEPQAEGTEKFGRKNFGAIFLILLGCLLLLNQIFPMALLDSRYFWPAVIILLGGYLLFFRKK